MRFIITVAFALALFTSAYAEEVVLELKNMDVDKLPNSVNTEESRQIKYTQIFAPPKDAKAPEGNLVWCRLLLGKSLYLMCYVLEGEKWTKLYIDRDGDNDLAEEKPIKFTTHKRGFKLFLLEDMPAKFKVGKDEINLKMRVGLFQRRFYWVAVWTTYAGKINVRGKEIPAAWLPGQKSVVLDSDLRTGSSRVLIGDKSLQFSNESVTIRDGKVVATYELKKADDLVEIKVPGGVVEVEAYTMDFGEVSCFPVDGKVCLPKGKYRYATGNMERELEGKKYFLRFYKQDFVVEEGVALGDVEPLSLSLGISAKGDSMHLSPTLTDASKRQAGISGEGFRIPPPTVKIMDADGKEIAVHQFRPG